MYRFIYLFILFFSTSLQASRSHLSIDDLTVLCIDQADYHRKD